MKKTVSIETENIIEWEEYWSSYGQNKEDMKK
jgi:hypothetical protein